MAQIQCPNCGGYRVNEQVVESKSVWMDRSTGAIHAGPPPKLPTSASDVIFGLIGLVLLIPFILPGVIYIKLMNRHFERRKAERLQLVEEQTNLRRATVRKLNFSCLLCGYRWGWEGEGEPVQEHPVQARPELIQKGAQRVDAEEAERRRQQEAAAAFYFLQQQPRGDS